MWRGGVERRCGEEVWRGGVDGRTHLQDAPTAFPLRAKDPALLEQPAVVEAPPLVELAERGQLLRHAHLLGLEHLELAHQGRLVLEVLPRRRPRGALRGVRVAERMAERVAERVAEARRDGGAGADLQRRLRAAREQSAVEEDDGKHARRRLVGDAVGGEEQPQRRHLRLRVQEPIPSSASPRGDTGHPQGSG